VILLGSAAGRQSQAQKEEKAWEHDHKDNGIVGRAILLVASGSNHDVKNRKLPPGFPEAAVKRVSTYRTGT